MFNQILKITLFTTIWFWLKPRWRSLLAFTVYVLFVHYLHREYLDYVEISGDQGFLVWSYVLKWVLLVSGLATYLIFGGIGVKAPPTKRPPRDQNETATDPSTSNEDDGFDFLREKKHLQSQADKLIEKE
jgi:hypothetical protein